MVCAAALEVQRIIKEEDLIEKARVAGKLLESKLKQTFESYPYVGNI